MRGMDDVERGYSARQRGISDLDVVVVVVSAGRDGGRRERRSCFGRNRRLCGSSIAFGGEPRRRPRPPPTPTVQLTLQGTFF